jgi:hypothetical protein
VGSAIGAVLAAFGFPLVAAAAIRLTGIAMIAGVLIGFCWAVAHFWNVGKP